MPEIDLDQARAARAEAQDERGFRFKGERFELPAEMPYEVLAPIGRLESDPGAVIEMMRALMGEEEHARFVALRPSIADLNALVGALMGEYGLGGAPASSNGGGGGGLDPKYPPSSPG